MSLSVTVSTDTEKTDLQARYHFRFSEKHWNVLSPEDSVYILLTKTFRIKSESLHMKYPKRFWISIYLDKINNIEIDTQKVK